MEKIEKNEFENLVRECKDGFITFNELIYLVNKDNSQNIHSRDYLKEIAVKEIGSDKLYRARHILDAMDKKWANYYSYDLRMGVLEIPMAINDIDDLCYCMGY